MSRNLAKSADVWRPAPSATLIATEKEARSNCQASENFLCAVNTEMIPSTAAHKSKLAGYTRNFR